MRWKGIITFFVFLAGGMVFSLPFMNRWLEKRIEKSCEAVSGARVEIDGFRLNLFKLSAQWGRIQVADPENTRSNILETGRAAFRMNPSAMWRKRVVIEELTLADVRSGTKRLTDGRLVRPPRKAQESAFSGLLESLRREMKEEIQKMPVMNLNLDDLKKKLNVDSLLALTDIRIVDRLDSVRRDVVQTAGKWDSVYQTFHPDEDLKRIYSDLSGIRVAEIKTVPELLLTLEKVEASRRTFSGLSGTITTHYQEIHRDFDRMGAYKNQFAGWIDEDYQSVLQKASLPDLSAGNLGKMLFGPSVMQQAERYVSYFLKVRSILEKSKKASRPGKVPRNTGLTIVYPEKHNWPKFLAESIFLSGTIGSNQETPGYALEGELRGVTTQPGIYGKPSRFRFQGASGDRRLVFSSMLDHTTEAARDSFQLSFSNIRLIRYSFENSPYLPEKINDGLTDVGFRFSVQNGGLSGILDIKARDVRFDFKQFYKQDAFIEIVRRVLSQNKDIAIRSSIGFSNGQLQFQVVSNLDRLISGELKQIASKAMFEAESRIMGYLNKQAAQRLPAVNALFDEKYGRFVIPLDGNQEARDQIERLFESKILELAGTIKERQGGSLEKKTFDYLEKLIKKQR